MATYLIRRLLIALVIIVIVTIIVFFSLRLLPGDPLVIFLGQSASSGVISAQEIERLRHIYGLDLPLIAQYGRWLWGVLQGNLGTSIFYHENVGTLMADRFPITLHLGLVAFVISNVGGILLGMIAAIRRGTWIDAVATTLANIGITIPVFWLGIMMILLFGLRLGWLPIAGYHSPTDDFWLSMQESVMPIVCLAVTGLAGTARLMRSSMLEVVRQDYIRTAWSKGLQERLVIMKHALKNSLIPIITVMGIGLGLIFGGSVLVETVFAIPGIGRLLVTSIFAQDYIVIQSGTLVVAMIIILANVFVDIAYGWLDPRIRYG
jgi:peptide/nickel transport system permease protein